MSEQNDQDIIPAGGPVDLSGGQGLPARITPDEVYQQIDRVMADINTPPAGFLSRLMSSDVRAVEAAKNQAQLERINARTVYIKGMRDVIAAYVDTHVQDIKLRGKAYLVPRVTELIDLLDQNTEASIIQMLRVYTWAAAQIAGMQLSPELKESQTTAAYNRAEQNQATLAAEQKTMIAEVSAKMREIIGS